MSIQASHPPIEVVQGGTVKSRPITYSVGGAPVTITSATLAIGDGSLRTLVVDGDEVTFPFIGDASTIKWPVGELPWDIRLKLSDGSVNFWLKGSFSVSASPHNRNTFSST